VSLEHTHTLSRRRFLGAAAGAAGAIALGGTWAGTARGGNGLLVPPGKRSIILFTVRDRIGAAPDSTGVPYGFEQVLARLAEIGYHGIEFAGYTQSTQILGRQITPAEIRTILDANGLIATGSHGNIPSTINDSTLAAFDAYLETANVLGQKYVGTGGDPTGSNFKADWDAAAERWNILGERAAAAGLKLYTHNHDAAYSFLLDSGPLDALGRPTRSSGIRKLEYFLGITNPRTCTWRWTSSGPTSRSIGSRRTRPRTARRRRTCSTPARSWRRTRSATPCSTPRTGSGPPSRPAWARAT
jgi:hypothetical protein